VPAGWEEVAAGATGGGGEPWAIDRGGRRARCAGLGLWAERGRVEEGRGAEASPFSQCRPFIERFRFGLLRREGRAP
jgi:hypothetical protein